MQNPTLGRRIASGLLALLMMLQVFSGIAMPAFADDGTPSMVATEDGAPAETPADAGDGAGSEVTVTPPGPDSGGGESTPEPEPTAVPVETPAPEATPDPAASATPEPTEEPTATPEPTLEPTMTPEPTETPAPGLTEEELAEKLEQLRLLFEQLPESAEEIQGYDEAQCIALMDICNKMAFASENLTDEQLAEFDVAFANEILVAVEARLAELSAEKTFVKLQIASESVYATEANVGDEVEMSVTLNRDDVDVIFQWQRAFTPEPEVNDEAIVDYTDMEQNIVATWYNYLLSDVREAANLEENPGATWQGMELWLAARDALEAIGESADELTFAWKTRNFAVDGFAVTAEKAEDGTIVLRADKEDTDEHFLGTLNDDGEYEFATTVAEEEEPVIWEDIEGANEATYLHTVDEEDRTAVYRCVVTIVDEQYFADLTAARAKAEFENAEPLDLTVDAAAEGEEAAEPTPEPELSEDVQKELDAEQAAREEADASSDEQLISGSKGFILPETMEEASERVFARFFALPRASGNVSLSNDRQWVVGVNSNYEYLTADMYAKTQQWLAEGRITQAQADMYWTQLELSEHTANEIDKVTGLPTGGTRPYIGFALTDGNKMEVLSEWYGKTVYFRQRGTSGPGIAVEIPASTLVGASGEQYKKAVTMLSAYIPDAGKAYWNGINDISNTGWHEDNNHIQIYNVPVESFNQNPAAYLVDAEGNYRMDSIAWGAGVYDEPDISGKTFWLLKDYLANGYGMMVGHDTMYAYAGTYYNARIADDTEVIDGEGPVYVRYGQDPNGQWHYPGDGCTEFKTWSRHGVTHGVECHSRMFPDHLLKFWIVPIDPNSGVTTYYPLNQLDPPYGHYNMNALMGENNADIFIDQRKVVSGKWHSDYEFFMDYEYSNPFEVPSRIMCTGGSHAAPWYKQVMYGSDVLRIKSYPFTNTDALNHPKHRTPTNYPYDFIGTGTTLKAEFTHTNMQVAFGQIWVDYANNSNSAAGGNGLLLNVGVEGHVGTNNFYLAGDGNFLMNQVGHLPQNNLTVREAELLVNTIMYISQRKQCEVCQSEQNDGKPSHFVHRVTSVNQKEILTALMNGGTFWYPLDDCYVLTDDLNLKLLFGNSWTGIKNFMGHWSSDIYEVTLPDNGTPLFLQGDYGEDGLVESERGKYTSGDTNFWNLGSDPTLSVPNVVKDGNVTIHTTGIARIMGTLAELFEEGQPADYAGYRLELRAEDNKAYFPQEEIDAGYKITSMVNSDGKYVMSNVPCVFGSELVEGTGTMRVRVFDRSGREVTEYGSIRVDVPAEFWDNNMTTPLYLGGNFSPRPIPDNTVYESIGATFVGEVGFEQQIPAGNIQWQWRRSETSNWESITTGPWGAGGYTISGPEYTQDEFGDAVTRTTLVLHQCQTKWSGFEFRVVFSDPNRGSSSTYDYYKVGRTFYITNDPNTEITASQAGGIYNAVFSKGNQGKLTVKPWPALSTISPESQSVLAGRKTEDYVSTVTYVLGEGGHGLGRDLQVTWQYNDGTSVWDDITWSDERGHMFLNHNELIRGSEVKLDPESEEYKAYDEYVDHAASQNHIDLYQSQAKINLDLVDIMMAGFRVRAVWSATTMSNEGYSHKGPSARLLVESPYVSSNLQSGDYNTTMNAVNTNRPDEHEDWLKAPHVSDQNHIVFNFNPTATSSLHVLDLSLLNRYKGGEGMNSIHGQTVMLGAHNVELCTTCGGSGLVQCPNCGGTGKIVASSAGDWIQDQQCTCEDPEKCLNGTCEDYDCEICWTYLGADEAVKIDHDDAVEVKIPVEKYVELGDPSTEDGEANPDLIGSGSTGGTTGGTEEPTEPTEPEGPTEPTEPEEPTVTEVTVYYTPNMKVHGRVRYEYDNGGVFEFDGIETFAGIIYLCVCDHIECKDCDYCKVVTSTLPEGSSAPCKRSIPCTFCNGIGLYVCTECGGVVNENYDSGVDNISDDTAKYVSILYYTPGVQVDPIWQYTKFGSTNYSVWNQSVAAQLSGNPNIKVETGYEDLGVVTSDSPYYCTAYDGYGVAVAYMTITGATDLMDDPTTGLRYFFRCYTEGNYTTYFQAQENHKKTFDASGAGELVVEYGIDLHHNGFTESGMNAINANGAVRTLEDAKAAVAGHPYSDWKYPNLSINALNGLRTVFIQYTSVCNSNDNMFWPTSGMRAGVDENGRPWTLTFNGSGFSTTYYDRFGTYHTGATSIVKSNIAMTIRSSTLICDDVWQEFLRNMTFRTYDAARGSNPDGSLEGGGVSVLWYIDENASTGNQKYYNAANGHMYEIVEDFDYVRRGRPTNDQAYRNGHEFCIQTSVAESLARAKPCWEIGEAHGYMLRVNDYQEVQFIHTLLNSVTHKPIIDSKSGTSYGPHEHNYAYDYRYGWAGEGAPVTASREDSDAGLWGHKLVFQYGDTGHWSDGAQDQHCGGWICEWGPDGESQGLKNSNHSAVDTDVIWTSYTPTAFKVRATVQGGVKIYDGRALEPTITITDEGGVRHPEWERYIVVSVSNGTSFHLNEHRSCNALNFGQYTVTLSLDMARINAENARITGFTQDSILQADLIIRSRPLDVVSENNDRIYNGGSVAKIDNITIKSYVQNSTDKSGIVAGDTVALNETLAYGYYSDQYPTDDFFSAEPEERIHTGNHAIKALTNLNLINNPYGNYYIRSETFTGSIKPRPLYLHSLYHDQTDYKWTYDSRARSIGAEKNLNDLVVYGDAELTVKEVYEAILAGTRNDRDTTRYVADQYRAYEEEVKDPNNYRMYDNTTAATISNISIDNVVLGDTVTTNRTSYAGVYDTMNAGETLVGQDENGDGGTIKPSVGDENRYWWLTENPITRTQDISLINNDYGDYYIADEDYSGAIYRAGLIAQINERQLLYGDGMDERPYTDEAYDSHSASTSWLHLTGLMGTDVLRMSDWTKAHKNEFKYDLYPEPDTPVGHYPLTYIGLNEENFSVLTNYIVQVGPASLVVNPRPIKISVDESLKDYGSENPQFFSQFAYKLTLGDADDWKPIGGDATDAYEDMNLVGGDTIADVLLVNDGTDLVPVEMVDGRGNIPYLSDAETNSNVLYIDQITENCEYCSERDGKDRTHFHLGGYAVWVNENEKVWNTLAIKSVTNMYGESVQNYSLEYEPNILKIHPISVTLVANDKEMVYGTTNEPKLTYTLIGRRVKWDDLSDVQLVRDAGVDVYDNYVIRVDSYQNASNYMVDTEDGRFKITPAYLLTTPDQHTKYYGDPGPEWHIGIAGFKYHDTVDSVFVDGKDAGRVDETGFDYIKSPVGQYQFHGDKNSLTMKPNRFGNYNYIITEELSTLNIIPRPITIEAGGWRKAFGTPDPEHTVLITDDLTGKTGTSGTDPNVCVDPEKAPITFDLTRAAGEEVGSYPIYVSAAEIEAGHEPGCHGEIDGLNSNYTIKYIPDNDVIYRSDALIGVVASHTRYYGDMPTEYIEKDKDSITYYLNGEEISPEEAGIIADPIFEHTNRQTSPVGAYPIYATVDSSKYEITVYPGYTTVIPRPVTVIAIDNEKVYGDADPALDFILHDGHSEDGETYYVGDKLTEKTGDAVKVNPEGLPGGVARQEGEDVGQYPININTVDPYDANGNMNYDIRFIEGNFTIKPAALIVRVLGGYKKAYGEQNPAFAADITGFKNGDTKETALTGELGFSTISQVTTPAGKYLVSAKPEIELEDGKTYKGSTLEPITNSNGLHNYDILYIDGDITISPMKIQIVIDNLKKVYGTEDPVYTYSIRNIDGSVASIIDPENSPLNLELTRTPGENVGKGDIESGDYKGAYTITGTYDNPNYDVEIIDGSLTIVKAVITVTVDGGYCKTYGDPNPEFGVVYDGFIGTEGHPDLTGTGIVDDESVIRGDLVIECLDREGNPVDEKTHTGNYPVKDDKSQLEADNYEFRYVNGDLTIVKKSIVIVIDDAEKIYGDEDPSNFPWHLENPDDLVNPDDIRRIDVTTERPDAGTDPGEKVGKHPITGSAEPMDDYDITVVPGTETIKPATIIVTVLPETKHYGEDNPEPRVVITGYKRGDTIEDIGGEKALVTEHEAVKWSPVGGGSLDDGKYPITAENSKFRNPNYEFVYIDGTLDILPLTVRIVVDDDEKVYGTHDPDKFTFHLEIADETGNPYDASEEQIRQIEKALDVSTARTPGEIVNQYPIKAAYTPNDSFEVTSCKDGTFTITPAKLVITANSAIKVYDGQPLTDKGYKAEGLVVAPELGINDTLESVTVTGSQTEVGESPNVPSDAVLSLQNGANGNRNYDITYVNGKLEVVPTEQVRIDKEANREHTTDGDTITYTIRVTNATLHDMTDVKVEDTNNFVSGIIIPKDAAYSYADGVFTIPSLPCASGENVFEIVYTYTVCAADHGTDGNDILANKAKVTDMTIPDGTEPGDDWKPETEEVEVPIIRHDLELVKSADKEVTTVGDTVNYEIKVTNRSNVMLENVVISDSNNFAGAITPKRSAGSVYNEDGTWTIAKLGVGVTVTIRYSYTVVEQDLYRGELDNVASGKIPPSDDIPEKDVPSNEVKVPITSRAVDIKKSVDKKVVYEGETVKYTLRVTNTGTADLSNLTVTDNSNGLGMILPLAGEGYAYADGVFTIDSLAAGERVDISYLYTVMNNDPQTITNVATVHVPEGDTGTDEDEPFDVPSNPVEVKVQKDGLTVEKDVVESIVSVGEEAHYTITVTNTGNTPLYHIILEDETTGEGATADTTSDSSVAYDEAQRRWVRSGVFRPGESFTVTYTYTAVEADAEAGKVDNTASALGTNPSGSVVHSDPDDAELIVGERTEAILDVTKTVDKDKALVGETLTYTVHVTNNGNAAAKNAIVSDFFDGVGEPSKSSGTGYQLMENGDFLIPELAAGASLDITYTYVVKAEDKDVIRNIVVIIPENPPVDIEKAADKNVATVNEVVNYTITVTNTTNEAKTDLIVTDTNNFAGEIEAHDGAGYTYNGDRTWTITNLAAGESIRIAYVYTVQTEDASTMVNKADVRYVDDGGAIVIESEPVEVKKPVEGEVTIVKSADKSEAKPGEVVSYTVTVHNGKTVDAHNLTVSDSNNFAGVIDGADGQGYRFEDGKFVIDELKAGASITLRYTYTVLPDDVVTEILRNVATVHVPGTNPEDPEHPGQGIDPEQPIDPDEDIPSNEVEVKVPGDSTETEIPKKGELTISKTVDKETAKVGDILNYTVKVSNTGDGALKDILVEDFFDGHGTLEFIPTIGVTPNADGTFSIASLPAGASMELHFTYTVVEGDTPAVLNAAVAEPHIPVEPVKSADKKFAQAGEVVTYTITVQNNDTTAKTNLLVEDANNFKGEISASDGEGYAYNGDKTWTIESLAAGASIEIVYTYTVESDDAAQLVNGAKVSYTEDGSKVEISTNTVVVEVPEPGHVSIHKSADKKVAKPGEVITYTVTLHNGKDVAANNVVVTDANNFAGEIAGVDGADYRFEDGKFIIDSIAAGADVTITYTYTVEIADVETHLLDNVATVHVPGTNPEDPENPGHGVDPEKPIDPDEDIPSNEVEVEVPGDSTETEIPEEPKEGRLVTEKTVDKAVAKVGDTLNYTVKVSNVGEGDLTNVTIEDFFDGHGELVFIPAVGIMPNGEGGYSIAKLPAGAFMTLRFTYVVVAEDAPEVLNAAVAEPEIPVEPAKSADKKFAQAGEVVTYTITVQNNDTTAKTNLLVEDTNNFKGEISASDGEGYAYNGDKTWTIASLAAGESIEIVYTYTVQHEDESQLVNDVKVIYTQDGAKVEIPTNTVVVEVPDDGTVSIHKEADKAKAKPGEVVTYTVTLHNGKTVAANDVVVSDSNNFAGDIVSVDGADYRFEDGKFIIDSIPADGIVTLVYAYTVQIADVPTHILENVATAHVPGTNPEDPENPGHGIDPDKPIDPDEDIPSNKVEVEVPGDETKTEIETPASMTVTKAADVESAKAGEYITYTITVANTGKKDIEKVTLTDTFNGTGDYEAESSDRYTVTSGGFFIPRLAAGETITIRYTYKVTEEDVALKVLENVVLTSTPTELDKPVPPVKEDVPVEHTTITKVADKKSVKVGETIHYTVTVENDGGADLENLLVKDFFGGAGDITAKSGEGYAYNGDKTWTIAKLDAGASIAIEYDYVVVAGDTEDVLNAVLVKDPEPDVDVEKSADKNVAKVTETVTYTITVSNKTADAVENLTVTDHNNFKGDIAAESSENCIYNGDGTWTIARMEAGETVTITYTYTVEGEDESTLVNDADVKYVYDGETQEVVSEPVIVTVPDDGKVSIVKSADKTKAEPGETVTYTVTVSNGKTSAVKDAVVTDANNFAGTIESVEGSGYRFEDGKFILDEIPAGGRVVITYTYLVEAADVDTHILENVATVKIPGTNPEDPENPGHGVDPEKPIDPDEEIPSNEVDVEVPGDSTDTPVETEKGLTITKSADRDEVKPGETIIYTLTVTNTGNEVLNGVKVKDTFSGHGDINAHEADGITYNGNNSWTIASLGIGETVEIKYSYLALAEDADMITNVAVATIPGTNPEDPENPGHGKDPEKPIDPDKDVPSNEVEIPVIIRNLSIVKMADKKSVTPGSAVTYTVRITNTGNVDLENVTVADVMENAAGKIEPAASYDYTFKDGKFIVDELKVGESVDVHYIYVAQEADAGKTIINVAIATIPGTNPEDPENPGQGVDPDKPVDPDTNVPSNEVRIPVIDKDFEIVKKADKKQVVVGETITYKLAITNTGVVELTNLAITDNNDGAGSITAASGDGYSYDATTKTFTIDHISVGETFTLTYTYVAQAADAGKTVTNVAVGFIPGTNPEDPENPGHGVDPDKPIDPDIEKPSNIIKVTVVETPQPTPAPKDPEKPDEPKPTPPPAVREPGKTGVGILEGGFVLPAMLALCGVTGAMFGLRKRKEDD